MRYPLVILSFVLSGCAGHIRPDPVMPAIQANYPTAEFSACEKHWNGLGICSLEKGARLDSLNVEIQGYYQGTIRVYSAACQIDDVFRYRDNQRVRYTIPGAADTNCLIGFTVSPEYPDESESGVVIHSFRGYIWIGVDAAENIHQNFTSKYVEDGDAEIAVVVPEAGAYEVAFRGCGMDFGPTMVDSVNGVVRLSLKQLGADDGIQKCVAQGGIRKDGFLNYVSWMIFSYDKKFVPLATPSVVLTSKKFDISADSVVAVVALDDEYVIGNHGKFRADRSQSHVVRVLTTGGRSLYGVWKPEIGGFEWMR